MPAPSSATTVSRPDLGKILYEYESGLGHNRFIGHFVLPIFRVQMATGQFPVVPKEAFLKIQETLRAAKSGFPRDDYTFELSNYNCVENAFEHPIDRVEAKLYARFFDAERMAAKRAYDKVARSREKAIATAVINTSNFTNHAVSVPWTTQATADPLGDINTGKQTIRSATGLLPNTLIIPFTAFLALGQCDAVIDRIKYTDASVRRGELSTQQLADYFGVEKVLVGDAVYDSNKKGKSATITEVWDATKGMLCITNDAGDILEPALGRTFQWDQMGSEEIQTESYYEAQTDSDVIRVRTFTDENLIYKDCGYLLGSITA